jgi:hypothetical protein
MKRLILLAVFWAVPSYAQIVNVQSMISNERKQGFSLGVDLQFDLRTGNTKLIHFGSSAIGAYRGGRHLVFLLARADYGEAGDPRVPFINKDLEHLRYRFTVLPWLKWEAFIQHDRDAFRRLSLRALGGTGPRVRIFENAQISFHAAIAYMFEYEELGGAGTELDYGEQDTNHRISSYLVFVLKLADKLSFAETAYFQPKIAGSTPRVNADKADYRLLSDSELTIQATTHLAFKIVFSASYDHQPPEGVEGLDTSLKNVLSVSF